MTVADLIEILEDAYDYDADAEVYVDIKGDMHPVPYASIACGWDEAPNGSVVIAID